MSRKILKTLFVFLIMYTCSFMKVGAFHEKIDSFVTTQNASYPESGLYGQTYKYATSETNSDNPKSFAVFCTAYSLLPGNGSCDLVDTWSEATKAGVAKIIDEYSFSNSAISTVNRNEELLKKNLQITLVINQFLIEKNNGGDENKILKNGVYTNPSLYFQTIDGINPNTVLQHAFDEYDRVSAIGENGENVKIEIRRDDSLKKIIYNPATMSSISSSLLEIEPSYIDRDSLTMRIQNQTINDIQIPNGVQINVFISGNQNDMGTPKAVLNSTTRFVNITEIPSTDKFYVKFELVDSRSDKSEQFIMTPAVYLTGKFEYRVASEYNCGVNAQTLTANTTEIRKVIAKNIKGFTFKTPGIPDYPLLQIVKTDSSDSSILLNDAKIKISYLVDGENVETYVKTGIDGKVLFEDIETNGEYCVEEVWAPSGYLLDDTRHCFNVNMNSSNGYTMSVTENDPKIEYNSTNELVVVTLPNTKNQISLGKINSSKNSDTFVAGAKLKLTATRSPNADPIVFNGETLEWTTTNQAKVLSGLPKGTYYLYEVESPSGYIMNIQPTIVYSKLTDKQPKKYVVDDSRTKIKIRKLDENKQFLAGATLQITDLDGNVVVEPWISGTNGETDHIVTGLDVQKKYYLEELSAPDGYAVSEKIRFQLSKKGEVIILQGEDADGHTVILSNTKNSIYIGKKDATGDKNVVGAYLQLLDSNKNIVKLKLVDNVLEPSSDGNDYWVSTLENQLISKLPKGKYYLKELKAPDGYVLDSTLMEFEIDKNGNLLLNNTIQDSKTLILSNNETKIYISKQDINNKGVELKGATLVLFDRNENEIDRWVSGEEPHLIVGLGTGTYTLTEISAPNGYSVAESITFSIDENGVVDGDTIMYNTPVVDVEKTSSFKSLLILSIGVISVAFGIFLFSYLIRKKNIEVNKV